MDRILYVNHINSPFETYTGANQRSNLILKSLLSKYEVDVLCFTYDKVPENAIENCTVYFHKMDESKTENSRFGKGSLYPVNEVYRYITENLLSKNDYKYVAVRYIPTVYLCGLENENNLIVDIDDLPEQLYKSLAKQSKFPRNIKRYYLSLLARFYTNKIVKKSVQVYLPNKKQCNYPNSIYLPNIPYPFFKNNIVQNIPFTQRKPVVLFVGAMNWGVNFKGIDYFIDHCWTVVRKEIPDVVLKIIGKNAPVNYQTKWKNIDGVEVAGFVDDLYNEYSNCKAIIVPVYSGAGTNIKVLEAMTTGRACVISEHASKGFEDDLVDGLNVFIARDAVDFATKLILALTDEEKATKIAINGISAIKDKYSFTYFCSQLLQGVL
jgi:glycosyltransferase involved in cell wall biosynthesis